MTFRWIVNYLKFISRSAEFSFNFISCIIIKKNTNTFQKILSYQKFSSYIIQYKYNDNNPIGYKRDRYNVIYDIKTKFWNIVGTHMINECHFFLPIEQTYIIQYFIEYLPIMRPKISDNERISLDIIAFSPFTCLL